MQSCGSVEVSHGKIRVRLLGSYHKISATSLQTKGAEVPGTSVPLIACERLLLHVERELEVDVIHQAREYHFATLRILLEGH